MKFVFPLLAASAGVALIGAARPDVGYQAPPADTVAVQMMAVYAQCMVSRDPQEARTLLAEDYRSDDYAKRIRNFSSFHRDCVPKGGALRFNEVVFAGDMAEALLNRAHLTADQLKAKAAGDTGQSVQRCVIQKKPEDVSALLATPHASREEAQAIEGLHDTLADCTPNGVTVTSNLVGLRARLALATYRLINGPAAAPAGM